MPCRACWLVQSKMRYEENKELRLKQTAIWQKANAEKMRGYLKRYEQSPKGQARHQVWVEANEERVREYQRASYRKHSAKRIAESAAWVKTHPEKMREYRRATYYRWKERMKASGALYAKAQVAQAIRKGLLVRPDCCEWCGKTGCKIQAAHHDYSKPLEVAWLCRSCHTRYDKEYPKIPFTLRVS